MATQPNGPSDEAPIDLRAYWRMIVRRRWVIASTVAAVFGATTLYTLRQPKVYAADTTVIIDSMPPKFLDSSQVGEVVEGGSGSYWFNKEYYETQYKVIVSRSVANRVVDKLGLASDAAFLGLDKIKDPLVRRQLLQKVDAPSVLQSKIKVQPVKDSRVAVISVEDVDPKRAALLANEVANAYMAESLALKLRATESANKWLEDRLATLQEQSKTSEMAVYEFKKQSDMLTTSLEDRQSMISQRLNALNQRLTDVRSKVAELQARADAMTQVKNSEASRKDIVHWAEALPVPDQGIIATLKMRYAEQRDECAALHDRYLPNHPKMQACNEKLEAARQDLRGELENLVQARQTELQEARGEEHNLNVLLEKTKAEAFEVNRKQIEFDRLKRDSDNNQRLFELVLKRLKDIELSGTLRTSNVRVLDAALAPGQAIKPRVRLNLALGLMLGLFGGLLLALALELLDTTLTTQEQVEEWLQIAFLGILPRAELRLGAGQDLLVHQEPRSPAAECCRSVRTNLLFMSPEKPLRSLLVTSSSPEDGKTTSAIWLSIAMAESGNRVLLIDADMRRPRVHRAFSVPNGSGLSSLIVGEAQLEDAIKSTNIPNLSVLPCGPVPPNPAELLHTAAFAKILKAAGERYDRIIVDSPPVGVVADGVVVATQVDGTVLVLKAGQTSRDLAKRTLRALRDVNARVLGTILNDVDLNDRRYGDYYAYHRYGYEAETNEKPA